MLSVQDLVSRTFELTQNPDEIVKALQDLADGKEDGALGKIELSRVSDDALQLAIDSGLVRKIAEELVSPQSWASKAWMVVRWLFTRCRNVTAK
jgi:hypothetical protein